MLVSRLLSKSSLPCKSSSKICLFVSSRAFIQTDAKPIAASRPPQIRIPKIVRDRKKIRPQHSMNFADQEKRRHVAIKMRKGRKDGSKTRQTQRSELEEVELSDVVPSESSESSETSMKRKKGEAGRDKFKRQYWGRSQRATKPYRILKSVKLDISEKFKKDLSYEASWEQCRSEQELTQYLSKLHEYEEHKRMAHPVNPDGNILWKPLYNYKNTKTTHVDQRPSYVKFMSNLKQENEQLYEQLSTPLDLNQVIDMSYLDLFENKEGPKIMDDSEYPEWVWSLVPESRRYTWTDLIQTPFENLSEIEKHRLFRKWRKTLIVANNLWSKSELGKYGKARKHYEDPWPAPITKLDIWNKEYYEEKEKREVLGDAYDPFDEEYVWDNYQKVGEQMASPNGDNMSPFPLEEQNFMLNNSDDADIEQFIDLEAYYGLKGKKTNVEPDEMVPEYVVYDAKTKTKAKE